MKIFDFFRRDKLSTAPYIKIGIEGEDISIECNINKNEEEIEKFIKLVYILQTGGLNESLFYAIDAAGKQKKSIAKMTEHIIESIVKLHEGDNEEASPDDTVVQPRDAFKGKMVQNEN